jgi:NhaC family Na+:H+ antiporter
VAPEPVPPQAEPPARPLTPIEVLLPIVLGGLALGLSFLLFGPAALGGPLQTAIITTTAGAMLIGWRAGHGFDAMGDAALASVLGGFDTIAVLFAVGALLGTWAMSGTLLALGYYLLQVLTPEWLYLTSALIAALIGFTIASAWTTASTIGICLVGIATQIGLDPAITAGAVISGAYFGDKLSPLSKKSRLTASLAGVPRRVHSREALWTSLPSFAACLVLFWWLGEPSSRDALEIIAGIDQALDIRPVLLLPLAAVIALSLLGVRPFITMFTGALVGAAVAVAAKPAIVVTFAANPELTPALALLKGAWQAMATGFVAGTGNAVLDTFLSRGGMARMLDTIWLISAALAFGGVIERIGLLSRLFEPIARRARSATALVSSTVGASFVTNLLTADQQAGTRLAERILKPAFDASGLSPVVLSRATADSANVTSVLIPWNSCGAYLAAALGVSTLAYAPYALFSLLSPLVTILIAALGIRMLPGSAVRRVSSDPAPGA